MAHDDIFMIQGNGLNLFLLRDFLSPGECSKLIELIDADKRPARVIGPLPQDYRTNESTPLGWSTNPLVERIDARIAELTGIAICFGEAMEGQRYAEGQQFKPHCDYFHTDQPYWPEQDALGGQRTWTVMMTLNQPEAGGGTMFPNAGIRMKPRPGNLLAWCNLRPDGECNIMSMHCGEPVEKGVKYIVTKWHRERRFRHSPDRGSAARLAEQAAARASLPPEVAFV
jgi:prolyl 4-hydroxylase